ncbi:LysR family transcriptional regulator [Sinirhodobacter populi]|uniref:LysR family transcriptional regulator n=1 Tax=Paenirhodobacter populi TaxID=2306993 RepID=A0A443K2D4_9RHOB|nr:LysR family transcriptional regulator [Sinirhodobacter populi]RWR26931.1 LysR family transcriptional regulator [Sinirhodobacter populi]
MTNISVGTMRNLPHLTYLEAFEAAARHLSFTRAAEELNCTQAAISQRVRALEHFFARPLFHRRTNGLELTDAGSAYLPGISDALDRAQIATEGMLGARAQASVTLSAPLSFVLLRLAPNLHRFAAAHPQIEIRVNSTIWTDPNVELADLSVRVLDLSPPEPGAIRLGEERLMLLCDPDTARAAPAAPEADWLNAHRLIYVQGRMQFLDRWAQVHGLVIAPGIAPIKADNAATALEIAATSGGITAVMSSYAASYLASGRLVAPFGAGDLLPLALHLVPNPTRRMSRPVTLFAQWLSRETPFV